MSVLFDFLLFFLSENDLAISNSFFLVAVGARDNKANLHKKITLKFKANFFESVQI